MASIEDWGMALGALILLPFAFSALVLMTVLWAIVKIIRWIMGE
tara:strand:+ start:86 stop:217 length:132 start_codon:yes stop_codon:yes gene_type:complete